MLALASAAILAVGASAAGSRQSTGGVSCSMNSTSFVVAQATTFNLARVTLTCSEPAGSTTLVLARQSGSKWVTLRSTTGSSETSGVYPVSVMELFKPHAVTPGNYRFTVTAATGGSSTVAFTVLPKNTVPKAPRAGFWTGASGVSFYVTPDQKHIVKLSWTYVAEGKSPNGQTCTAHGTYGQKAPIAITGPAYARMFNVKEAFSTGGWFDTPTRAEGASTSFTVPTVCGEGYAKGLFVATWRNTSQPK